MTFKYILPDTPKLILATTGTDVFEATIGSLVYSPSSVVDDLVEQAWERFGNRPIGDYDYEHWIPIFKDAVDYNWRWYEKALPTIIGTEAYINLYDSSSTMTENDSVITESDSTNSGTNTGTVGVSGTFTNTNSGSVVQAQESMPDTASPSNYLAGRVTTTDTTALGNTHTDTTTNNLANSGTSSNDSETTRVHTITNNNKSKPSITITLEMIKQLEELNDIYLSRLDKYFMNRW